MAQAHADHWQLIQELIEAWEAKQEAPPDLEKVRRSQADYPVLHGLAAHAHRQARAVLVLRDAGLLTEAIPLIRSAYETAITAAWISVVDDGLTAFGQEDARNHENLITLIKKMHPDVEDHPSTAETIKAIKEMETSAKDRARSFVRICEDIAQVGDQGYFFYRVLSAFSHPNTEIANLYMEPPASEGETPILRFDPRPVLKDSWAPILFGSLIWAGQAVESREASSSGRKKYLRGMAVKGGVAPDLRPTGEVWLREHRARREQKQRERAAADADRAQKKAAKK